MEALIEEDAPSAAAAGIVKKAEEPGEFFEGEGATMGVPGVAKGRCEGGFDVVGEGHSHGSGIYDETQLTTLVRTVSVKEFFFIDGRGTRGVRVA